MNRKTLAEQMADQLQEQILRGEYAPGQVLPTEPGLCELFSVSRTVVRDALRLLSARGLVQVYHGKGVFVSSDLDEAFSNALLLALRWAGASSWDLQEFEEEMYPMALRLAARKAREDSSDPEIIHLKEAAEAYIDILSRADGIEEFRRLLSALMAAGGNKLLAILGPSLAALRNYRVWKDNPEIGQSEIRLMEAESVRRLIFLVLSGDEEEAVKQGRVFFSIPPSAESGMRKTSIGEASGVPESFPPADTEKY